MTSKAYFKALMVLHGALMIGQVLFGVIMYVVYLSDKQTGGRHFQNPDLSSRQSPEALFYFIALALVLATVLASYFVYRTRVGHAKEERTLSGITTAYRGAVIARDGCLQGPSMLAVIAFYLYRDPSYLFLTGLIVFFFLLWWPTRDKTIADLELVGEYRARLEDPDALI